MGKSIFVTYKYSDANVQALPRIFGPTTARDYVDEITTLISSEDHIYKGENDGESMQTLKDTTIGSKLGDKIFYSSVTVIVISKGMKNLLLTENDQWIPWEISYSLKEQSRAGRSSKTNAILAVVIPDQIGSYSHFFVDNPGCNSISWMTGNVFQIIRDNMFNIKPSKADTRQCNGATIYEGYSSYIHAVKWEDFRQDMTRYIQIADGIKEKIADYEIKKLIN